MPIRYKTGNKATFVVAGGLTAAFVSHIKEIDPGRWTIGTRSVAVLADEDFDRLHPEDLATPNEIGGTLNFADNVVPPQLGDFGTGTVTFPGGGILAADGFFTDFKFPTLANNQTMESEFKFQASGDDLSYTPGGAT